jgi:hypothetical protein
MMNVFNPFTDPPLEQPPNNFIERGITEGIEKGMGKIGDKILNAGVVKLDSFAHNLPDLVTMGLVSYYVYLGYKTFLTRKPTDLSKVFPITMVYIIFRIFWKVVLKI